MARGIKQIKKEGTDFSITDAVKRAKTRRSQLDEAAGIPSNPVDDLSDALDRGNESEDVYKIFED